MGRAAWMASLTVAMFIFLPEAAQGGLENTHHYVMVDLYSKNVCMACHGYESTLHYGMMEEDLGRVGGLCIFTCHSGKGILPETDTLVPMAGPSVDIEDYTTKQLPDYTVVFFTKSHGRKPRNLKARNGQPVPWPPPGVPLGRVGPDMELECTSCHNVHDNSHSPFLNAPLASSYPDMNGLCDRCHTNHATNNLTGAPDGNHPVDFTVDTRASSSRGEYGRHPRRINIQKYGNKEGSGAVNVFDVPNPPPAALNNKGTSWNMGGHLIPGPDKAMTAWTGEGSMQQLGCYTCHSAHRHNVNGEEHLVVLKSTDARNGWNPLCVGCHGAATSLAGDMAEWNVGLSNFGHPAAANTIRDESGRYTTTVGGFKFKIAVVTHAADRNNGNPIGDRGQIMCTTCHKVHFGVEGSMAIANLGQGKKAVCKSCHSGLGTPNENDWSKGGTVITGHNAPNSHHATATKVTLLGEHLPANESTGPLNIQLPSWANTAKGLGDIASGMDCADCHTFNGTAHNW